MREKTMDEIEALRYVANLLRTEAAARPVGHAYRAAARWLDAQAENQADNDPVAYARAHLTSPGALALLDEVERGRQRSAARATEVVWGVTREEIERRAGRPVSFGELVRIRAVIRDSTVRETINAAVGQVCGHEGDAL